VVLSNSAENLALAELEQDSGEKQERPQWDLIDDEGLILFQWTSLEERKFRSPMGPSEEEKGSKQEHWFSLPASEIFAFAGIWRPTEAGKAYAMSVA
jgi:hypothetical protein